MKLFVGNLPFSASEDEICALFEPYGSVTDFYLPLDRESGRPRGFAFVTMDSREAGERAIEELDGKEFAGREVRINEAMERERGGGGGGGFGGGGGGGGYGGGGGGGGGGRGRDGGKRRSGGGGGGGGGGGRRDTRW